MMTVTMMITTVLKVMMVTTVMMVMAVMTVMNDHQVIIIIIIIIITVTGIAVEPHILDSAGVRCQIARAAASDPGPRHWRSPGHHVVLTLF